MFLLMKMFSFVSVSWSLLLFYDLLLLLFNGRDLSGTCSISISSHHGAYTLKLCFLWWYHILSNLLVFFPLSFLPILPFFVTDSHYVVLLSLFAWNSLCRPVWLWTHRDSSDSASWVLELIVYMYMPNIIFSWWLNTTSPI